MSICHIFLGDSEKVISDSIQDKSIDSVITDPPYGIGISFGGGNKWDKCLPSIKIWEQCFRVLKPGGFLLAFSHVRMYHRLCCHLEDSGFVIKDCLCWAQANSFPKSYNISKAFDDRNGCDRPIVGKRFHPTLKKDPKKKSNAYHRDGLSSHDAMESWDITEPVTEDAKNWYGWGTSLKVSWEPIIMCQKPIEGTYIENISKYKVGALNIDACRIPYASEEDKKSLESFLHFAGQKSGDKDYFSSNQNGLKQVNIHPDGRWPANIFWLDPLFADYDHIFMIPKPASSEKKKYNTHPTVKPVRLMERLISLVTPKPSVVGSDVIVLDPFCGSGTTGVACKRLHRKFIGIEIDESNYNIAQNRVSEKQRCQDIFEV